MGLEACPSCGALTRVYADAGDRRHEPDCPLGRPPEVCFSCNGTGGGERLMDLFGQVDWIECGWCRGTGLNYTVEP